MDNNNFIKSKKVKYISLAIICLIIIFIIAVIQAPIRVALLKNDFSNNVKSKILNNQLYDSYELLGEYYNDLIINNSQFNNFNYDEKVEYIKQFDFNTFFNNYYVKVREIVDDIPYNSNVIVMSNGIKYEYSYPNLIVDDKPYTKKDNIIENIKLRLSKSTSQEEILDIVKKNTFTTDDLITISKFGDDILSNEIMYSYAKKIYKSGDINGTLQILKKLDNYSDANKLIEKCNLIIKLNGSYKGNEYYNYTYPLLVINTTKVYLKHSTLGSLEYSEIVNEYDIKDIENDKINLSNNMSIQIEGDVIRIIDKGQYANYNNSTFKKNSNSTIKPVPTIKPKKPKVGMTKEEIKNSTWGEPNKINKDTYSWGTAEQWCYSGYKYIYFRNGTVSSISE